MARSRKRKCGRPGRPENNPPVTGEVAKDCHFWLTRPRSSAIEPLGSWLWEAIKKAKVRE